MVLVPVDLGLVVRVVRVVLDLEVPVVLGRVARVDLVGLMGPVALVGRLLLGLVGRLLLGLVVRVDPVGLMGRMGLVAPAVLVVLVVLDQMVPVGPVVLGRRVLAVLVVLDQMGLAARVGPGDPVALSTAVLVGLVVPADLSTAVRVVPVGLVGRAVLVVPDTAGRAVPVAPAGRHRRHMCNRVTMTAVARSGVDRGTHRTASALRVTERLHLRPRTASGGMGGLLPGRRRPTGTVRRLPEVGMGRHPPAGGIRNGTDRRTISVGGRRTMARSTTTDTTPRRSSTRCSVAGASGSSVRGFRCTDLRPA